MYNMLTEGGRGTLHLGSEQDSPPLTYPAGSDSLHVHELIITETGLDSGLS